MKVAQAQALEPAPAQGFTNEMKIKAQIERNV